MSTSTKTWGMYLLCLFVVACDDAPESGPASPIGSPTSDGSRAPAAYLTTRGETDLIRLDSPKPGDTITSPLTIRGVARGNWYFEGDFPVVLTDWNGLIIAEHYATAQSEWMTTELVPFESVLEFEIPPDVGSFSRRGSLILQKDNPSGLPENDDALEITVFFPAPD